MTVKKVRPTLSERGHGYVTYTEDPSLRQLSPTEVEMIVNEIIGKKYRLLTVNNSTDSRKATRDPRVYTLLIESAYMKMKARELQKKYRK